MKTFKEFLADIHWRENQKILLKPHAFNNWLLMLGRQTMMDYADLYGQELLEELKRENNII